MIRVLSILSILLISLQTAGAAFDVESKASLCAICHEHSGDALVPTLSGQSKAYLLQQLKRYQSGERESSVMSAVVKSFSNDQEMAAVAEYFSKQEAKGGTVADSEQFYVGKHIFEQKLACVSCHGFDGQGKSGKNLIVPNLVGQKSEYIIQRLKDFRESQQKENPMVQVAEKLEDSEIESIASYLSGM